MCKSPCGDPGRSGRSTVRGCKDLDQNMVRQLVLVQAIVSDQWHDAHFALRKIVKRRDPLVAMVGIRMLWVDPHGDPGGLGGSTFDFLALPLPSWPFGFLPASY